MKNINRLFEKAKNNAYIHIEATGYYKEEFMTEILSMEFSGNIRKAARWHLLAGVLMIVLGLWVWFNPVASLLGLALYIGIAFLLVGAGYLAASFSFRSGWFLLVGLLDVFVGLILVANLGVTAATLPVIFALWCLAVGAAQLVSSFNLKKDGFPWGWTFGIGLLGILFAFLILVFPALGAVTITTLAGAYAVLYGVLAVAEYFFWRKILPQEMAK